MKVGECSEPRSTKGDLESPWIWNEPQRSVLSTFNHCRVLRNVITFPVYFPRHVHPGSKYFIGWGFCRTGMLSCHVDMCREAIFFFFACFTVCSSPLRSSFQSYSRGSESGGHPGGKERLLHCHEWRGHALQLGKLGPVLLKRLCDISLCAHVYYFVHPTAAITTPLSSPLDLSTHQICPCVAVWHFLPPLY